MLKLGSNGKLFGGITSKEISEELKKQLNIEIDKKKIVLNDVIKQEGIFYVKLKLLEGITAEIKVQVKAI